MNCSGGPFCFSLGLFSHLFYDKLADQVFPGLLDFLLHEIAHVVLEMSVSPRPGVHQCVQAKETL